MAKYLTPAPEGGGEPPRRSTGARATRRPVIAYVVAAVLIVGGLFSGFVAYSMLRYKTLDIGSAITQNFFASPQEAFRKDRIYTLVLGIDYDYDDKGQRSSAHSRSDTIKVASMDFTTKQLRTISVLRDSAWDVDGTGRLDKINDAYSIGGVKMADRAVGQYLGMTPNEKGEYFDRHVVVRVSGLQQLVDAMGGIDLRVEQAMDYDDNWAGLHIHFKPGMQHMNGYQAQAYSRFRHDACSDPCRTKRQDQVINAILAKLKGDKLNDVTHIVGLMDVARRNIMTDLTTDEEKSLAFYYKDAIGPGAVKGETIPYVDTRDTPNGEVVLPDPAAKAAIVAKFTGPYVVPTTVPSAALAQIDRKQVHVEVRNGTGVNGLGSRAATALRKLGYTVEGVTNADSTNHDTTQIQVSARPAHLGERVRADLHLPDATIGAPVPGAPEANAVTITVGNDFATAAAPQAVPTKPSGT